VHAWQVVHRACALADALPDQSLAVLQTGPPLVQDAAAWPDVVASAVNGGYGAPHQAKYVVCKHASLGQMRLVLLARRDVMALLGKLSVSTVATGVAGLGANKGAVAISCQVLGTLLCFVNTHLAAHQGRTAERNKMFRVCFAAELCHFHPCMVATPSSFTLCGDLVETSVGTTSCGAEGRRAARCASPSVPVYLTHLLVCRAL
jgi:hypothetical protein